MGSVGKLLVWAVIIAAAGYGLFMGMEVLLHSSRSVGSDTRVERLISEAKTLRSEGDYERAENRLRGAFEIDPESSAVVLALSDLLIEQEREREASTLLNALFRRTHSTGMADMIYWTARFMYNDRETEFQRRFTRAIELLDVYVEYRPGDYRAWLLKGVMHARLRQNRLARESFGFVIENSTDASEVQNARNFMQEYNLQ